LRQGAFGRLVGIDEVDPVGHEIFELVGEGESSLIGVCDVLGGEPSNRGWFAGPAAPILFSAAGALASRRSLPPTFILARKNARSHRTDDGGSLSGGQVQPID